MGSFFNVLIDRLPRKESILFPASHCSDCGYKIPPWMNIPIVSFIVIRGKCTKCGAKIHWHHLVVEIITPILFIMIFLRYEIDSILFYKYLVLVSFLIPIFFIDAFHHLIMHATSLPLIGLGLLFSIIPGNDISLPNSLLTGIGVFSFLLSVAYIVGKIKKMEVLGGGDLWLLTGLACFFGALAIPWILVLACLLGIIFFLFFIRSRDQVFGFGPFIVLGSILWIMGFDKIVLPFMLL